MRISQEPLRLGYEWRETFKGVAREVAEVVEDTPANMTKVVGDKYTEGLSVVPFKPEGLNPYIRHWADAMNGGYVGDVGKEYTKDEIEGALDDYIELVREDDGFAEKPLTQDVFEICVGIEAAKIALSKLSY